MYGAILPAAAQQIVPLIEAGLGSFCLFYWKLWSLFRTGRAVPIRQRYV